MLVEILVNRSRYRKGQIIDVSEDLARQLIDGELAKEVNKKPKEGEEDERTE